MTRLLLVDDEERICVTLSASLRAKGFEVTTASTVRQALELINSTPFDVLLSDLNVGEPGDGFTVVSAMRRVQPAASTFILTGYPDFESALRAIRNQVDDYFTKPTDIHELAAAVLAKLSNRSPMKPPLRLKRVCDVLGEQLSSISAEWLAAISADAALASMPVSTVEREEHVRTFIGEIVTRLEQGLERPSPAGTEAAQKLGRLRHLRGYTLQQVVTEATLLQHIITSVVERNLLGVDLSTLIHDMLQVGEALNSLLEITIHAYQSLVPRSLQTSFALLYRSAHLGVAIASEERIIDANDAWLRMIRHTRQDLLEGRIDWQAMTPPEYHELDRNGIAQLREYGVCVPFEKEFILSDGSRLPFMIGAVRLSSEPFEWAAYIVDLSEQRRTLVDERRASELAAKYAFMNQVAHEINNPLAALTFTLHLLLTYKDLSPDVLKLIGESAAMVDRISGSLQSVLATANQGVTRESASLATEYEEAAS